MVGQHRGPIVDQTPLLTAQRLAQMPTTAEELPFAQEALRLGDHDMDLAFAAAVRDAQEHPPVLSAEAKEIEAALQLSERAVEADKGRDRAAHRRLRKGRRGTKRDALMISWMSQKRSRSWIRMKPTMPSRT